MGRNLENDNFVCLDRLELPTSIDSIFFSSLGVIKDVGDLFDSIQKRTTPWQQKGP